MAVVVVLVGEVKNIISCPDNNEFSGSKLLLVTMFVMSCNGMFD